MSSYSSRDVLSHPYQYQRQRQGQNRGPSFDNSSSPSHPTAAPAPTPASPAVQPSLVHHPGLSGFSHNLVDPAPSPAVRRLPGTGFDDLTQQGPARSGVRSVRSYSSPPLASGLNTGLAGSSLYPGSNLCIQSASSSFATNQRVYSLAQRSSLSGSEAFLSGNMAPEGPSWSWQGRQSNPHPYQSSSMGYDQSYHPSQSLPQESFSYNYNVPQGSPRGYYQPGGLPSSYLPVPPQGPSQPSSQPRSASMSYALPSNAMAGNVSNMPDPSYLSPSPSYFPGQSDYYLPVSSLPTHHPSIPTATSPQPHPGPPTYPSPESGSSSAPHASTDPDSQVRVLSFRPKPQCWEHGCNGREFSTFSNLLRHQREKSGVVAKAECPICGAAFTRTTARNIHVAQGKCKGGRESSTE